MVLLHLIALLLANPPANGKPSTTVERSFWSMGTRLDLVIEAKTLDTAIAASELALRRIEQVDAEVSTFRDDTPMAALNRARVGEQVPIPVELAQLLVEAEHCKDSTLGGFDPAIGSRKPTEREPRSTSNHLTEAAGPLQAWRAGAVELDAGGFGKGAALDRALASLSADSSVAVASIDFGGQLAFLRKARPQTKGRRPSTHSARLTVDVAHPLVRSRAVLTVDLSGHIDQNGSSDAALRLSIATSGNSERGSGSTLEPSHILDPRTGTPAPDFGSLTVFSSSAFWADCLSTGLYVLGPDRAHEIAATLDGVEIVTLEPTPGGGLRARPSRAIGQALIWADPEVDILPIDQVAINPVAIDPSPPDPAPIEPAQTSAGRSLSGGGP